MKKGDIVIMPGETRVGDQHKGLEPEGMSIGIIMSTPEPDARRVEVFWNDAEGVVYTEPKAWLQVIGHIDGWGLKYNMLNASEIFVTGMGVQSFSS